MITEIEEAGMEMRLFPLYDINGNKNFKLITYGTNLLSRFSAIQRGQFKY